MSVVDDGWRLRRDAVVQVAVSTARVDGYSVVRRWRTRVGIEVQRLLVERAWGSRHSMFWMSSVLGSWPL